MGMNLEKLYCMGQEGLGQCGRMDEKQNLPFSKPLGHQPLATEISAATLGLGKQLWAQPGPSLLLNLLLPLLVFLVAQGPLVAQS